MLCQSPEHKLKQVCLQDMKTDEVCQNSILWTTVICAPYKNAGCYVLLEDDNYEVIEAQLFNSISFNAFQDVLD
ncbi:SET_domain-containing protein [Hexamita inflata]|uniref:SET_domain-containing protein n=1 Tax=Hexamita inflata TaxID=28002 RepID=A0ABP1GUE3_9EUKA